MKTLQEHEQEKEAQMAADPVRQDGTGFGAKLQALVRSMVPWATKGGLAIIDQGLISGSNFIISVLLARWLMPGQYGAYAVAFGIYMLLRLLYQSLILEPMGVFGGSSFRKNLRDYLRSLLWLHLLLSAVIFAALGFTFGVAHRTGMESTLISALAGVTLACPPLLLFALARRSFYVELEPAPAAAGAFIYSALVLAGLFVVNQRGLLSPFSAFLLMGAGSLITGLLLMWRLRSELSHDGAAPSVKEAWSKHWRYGRWAIASCFAIWLPSYIYYPLLSSFAGMAQSGQLKALMNLTLPFEQARDVLCMLFLPYAARIMHQHGKAGTRMFVNKLTLLGAGAAFAYWAVIIPLHRPIFHFLYSGRYLEVSYLLPALALGQIFWSAASGPAIALRAMESPASVFAAFGVATAISLLVGVPAAWFFGVRGCIWGSNVADILSLLAVLFVLRRKLGAEGSARGTFWSGLLKPVEEVSGD